MGKNEDDALKFIGALVLGKLLIDALKKFRCPRCNYPIDQNETFCPNCRQPIIWGPR